MKPSLYILALAISFNASSQSLCGTAGEGGSVTLTAPAGKVFTSVTFASYGTPNGSCGAFTIGSCHATNSQTIVETALLNKNTATINATNTVFGDPCGGTVKRLYIEAVYGSSLPLHLISFLCATGDNANTLGWETAEEVNTQSFGVERSVDGVQFLPIGIVAAQNKVGTNLYTFTDKFITQNVFFYRLKMIDLDGSYAYSNILKSKAGKTDKLVIYPNPVTNYVSIGGVGTKGMIEMKNLQGLTLKQMPVSGGSISFDISTYPAGMYILKYTSGQKTSYQKLVKQ